MRSTLTIFILLLSGNLVGQVKHSGDLEGALLIPVNTSKSFKQEVRGFGRKQEIGLHKNPHLFEAERNTTWLKLAIPQSGTFIFEIKPHLVTDDFDWMLFSQSRTLATALLKGSASPLRSNNARTDISLKGKTGLKEGFTNLYASPGPGKSFSKPLEVRKGDTLLIVIDNVNSGKGFDFVSNLKLDAAALDGKITGRVTNSANKAPLAAKVVCEDDSTGAVLSQTIADSKGNYSINIPLGKSVNVTAQHQGFIFKTADLRTKANSQLDLALDPITNSARLTLYNIHFSPDKDVILPGAVPELERLVDILQKEPAFDIKIIGHTNHNPFADSRYLQRLSFNRAIAVKKVLLKSGVSDERISCSGMGGKSPLTNSRVAEEAIKNLRVEVVLVKREE